MKFETAFLKFSDVCNSYYKDKWECRMSTVLTTIAFTFLLLFGTFGNIASLCVLLRKKMRKLSVSTFITFLTVSDTFNLWITCTRYLSQHFNDESLTQKSTMSCKILPWMHLNFASFSLWCIAAFSMHRLTCLRTTTTRISGQKKYEVFGLLCLLIVTCSLNSPVLYGNALKAEKQTSEKFAQSTNESQANIFPVNDKHLENQTQDKPLNISQSNWLADVEDDITDYSVENAINDSRSLEYNCVYISKEFEAFMIGIWLPFYITIYIFLPVIIIVICNLGIAYTVIKSRRTVAALQNTQLNHSKYSGTRILTVLSCYMLLAIIPLCVYVLILSDNKGPHIQTTTYTVQIGILFLYYSTYAMNGALCLWFGRMFRHEFLAMLIEVKMAIVALRRTTRVNTE